jgi:hypothetical protein
MSTFVEGEFGRLLSSADWESSFGDSRRDAWQPIAGGAYWVGVIARPI